MKRANAIEKFQVEQLHLWKTIIAFVCKTHETVDHLCSFRHNGIDATKIWPEAQANNVFPESESERERETID